MKFKFCIDVNQTMSSPKRPPRRTSVAALAFALLILSPACAKNDPPAPPAAATTAATTVAPDEVIATVNGRPVPRKLYEMFLRNGREALGINPGTEEGQRKLNELREGRRRRRV